MPILVPAYGYPNPSGGNLNVTYSGDVPQYPGLYQVNFQIAPGENHRASQVVDDVVD